MEKLKIGQTIYYFDGNHRIYAKNKSRPIYKKYFIPMKIVGENKKEYIFDYGVINKRSGMLNLRGIKTEIFTEKEKQDNIYINDNAYRISEEIRCLNADKLKEIEKIIKSPNLTN